MTEIETIVASLWDLDDDILEAQLGSHAQAIEDDVAGRGAKGVDLTSWESIDVNVVARASIDKKFLDAGRQLFERVNPLVYELMCKPLGENPTQTCNLSYEKELRNRNACLSLH